MTNNIDKIRREAEIFVNNLSPLEFEIFRSHVNRRYSLGVTAEASKIVLTSREKAQCEDKFVQSVKSVRERLGCPLHVAHRAVELYRSSLHRNR